MERSKLTIIYQGEKTYYKSKLTLSIHSQLVKAAKDRNFNISKMVEDMLIQAIQEHDTKAATRKQQEQKVRVL